MCDFDRKLDQRGFDEKWDSPRYPVAEGKPLIPMWVADMDFAVPDCVLNAIRARLEHPAFGYSDPDPRFAQSIIGWAKERRGVTDLRPELIRCQNSALGGVVAAIKTFTQLGDPVLVHLPNYNGFTHAIADAGRRLVGSPLVQDGDGVFRVDLADMERRILEENIKCLLFCAPHNPTGRVWTQEETEQVCALCEKHKVSIISDEVWADFVYAPARHVSPVQASQYARENTVVICGASKTFNLAGLHTSYSVVYNDELRRRFHKWSAESYCNDPNTLSVAALVGAYTGGARYVEELTAYIRKNMELAHDVITREIPGVRSSLPEGTYTMWLDFTGSGHSQEENIRRLGGQGLVLSPGGDYHGEGWFRMNVACPRAQVEQALQALKAAMA